MKHDPFVSRSTLESDLRSRIEAEIRDLEEQRGRLERDAHAADELLRRVGSMLSAPSAAAVSLFPSLASGNEVAHIPSSHARTARRSALAGIAATLAVAMSFAALFVASGHRAEIATAIAAEPAPPHPRGTACNGLFEAPARTVAAAASSPPSPSPSSLPIAPSRPLPAARMANTAPRARATPDAPKALAPEATSSEPPKLEDAARTAAMLREQLATALP